MPATLTANGYQVDDIIPPSVAMAARLAALEARPVLTIATANPMPEATAPAPGTLGQVADAQHVHQRLTSATNHTTDANGQCTCAFTCTFDAAPRIPQPVYEEAATGQPVIFKRTGWVKDANGKYIGVVLQAYRLQKLPAVLALLSALLSYDVAGGSAANVNFDLVAIKAS